MKEREITILLGAAIIAMIGCIFYAFYEPEPEMSATEVEASDCMTTAVEYCGKNDLDCIDIFNDICQGG